MKTIEEQLTIAAKNNMIMFNVHSFKILHPSLFKTIQECLQNQEDKIIKLKEIISVSRCTLCSNTGNVQQEHDSDPKVDCAFCKSKEELL